MIRAGAIGLLFTLAACAGARAQPGEALPGAAQGKTAAQPGGLDVVDQISPPGSGALGALEQLPPDARERSDAGPETLRARGQVDAARAELARALLAYEEVELRAWLFSAPDDIDRLALLKALGLNQSLSAEEAQAVARQGLLRARLEGVAAGVQ